MPWYILQLVGPSGEVVWESGHKFLSTAVLQATMYYLPPKPFEECPPEPGYLSAWSNGPFTLRIKQTTTGER